MLDKDLNVETGLRRRQGYESLWAMRIARSEEEISA